MNEMTERLLTCLRHESQDVHARVHRLEPLRRVLGAQVDRISYVALLQKLYTFYHWIDQGVLVAIRRGQLASVYEYPLRHRLIAQDLHDAGAQSLYSSGRMLPPLQIKNHSALIGTLYVVEGSTRGGAQSLKGLKRGSGNHALPARYFSWCEANAGLRWESWLEYVDRLAEPCSARDAGAMSVSVFERFHDLMSR